MTQNREPRNSTLLINPTDIWQRGRSNLMQARRKIVFPEW